MLPRSNRMRRILHTSLKCSIASLCILLSVMSEVNAQGPAALAAISVGGFVDTQQCNEDLIESDSNDDGEISPDEYVGFVQKLGPPGFLEGAKDYGDLPLPFQATFVYLACLCETDMCCEGSNAHITLEGLYPDDVPSSEETAYLFTVCLLTDNTITRVLSSMSPTVSPTFLPTVDSSAPSVSPSTLEPTLSIEPTTTPLPVTDAPTITMEPTTLAPSTSQEPSPAAPTVAPSFSPSDIPSLRPTKEPTDMPSSSPTLAPTTPASSSSPTATPAPTVSAEPSAVPTPTPVTRVGAFYSIVVANGNNSPDSVPESGYKDDLISAMDKVATDVLAATDLSVRLRVRKLRASVRIPTLIDEIRDDECPDFISDNDACREVDAAVVVELDGDNAGAVQTKFGDALDAAIEAGDLQRALPSDSPVRILDSITPPGSSDDGGIGGRAIGGISAAAAVLLLAAIGFLIVGGRRRGGSEKEDDDHQFPTTPVDTPPSPTEMKDDGNLGASKPDYGENMKQQVVNLDGMEEEEKIPVAMGAVSHDSSSNAGSSGWSSSAGISSLNTGSVDDSLDFKSGAGAKLAAIGAASAIAGGAVVAAAAKKGEEDEEEESGDKTKGTTQIDASELPEVSNATRGDLDNAIEAGNWAAVGATAALLAAASDSQSFSSRSRASRNSASRGGSDVSSVDAARAAELDHLVDAGDWEGVVLAAAKFEASSASDSNSKGSGASASGASQTRSGTGSASSAYSQSNYSSTESPAKALKRAETRAEVEELVRRVVPDEIDNVDEMMLQFKGREEELVETLKTMQERSIAQRARVAKQKSAKREARRSRVEGGLPPIAPPAVGGGDGGISGAAVAGIAGGAAAAGLVAAAAIGSRDSKDSESEGPMHENSSASESASDVPILSSEGSVGADSESAGSGKRRRTALELAIEAGDWEAVGDAAAMMSDTSVTTASSAEINALAAGGSYTSEDTSSKKTKEGVNAERAAELDAMIDSGDWTGVVAAASSYSKSSSGKSGGDAVVEGAATTETAEKSDKDSPGKSSTESSASGQRRSWFGGKKPAEKNAPSEKAGLKEDSSSGSSGDKALNEEQEALAQAEIWMQIAEQSKQEGSTEDRGASDAADWAIARSLSAMKQADEKGEPKSASSKTPKPDEDDKSV